MVENSRDIREELEDEDNKYVALLIIDNIIVGNVYCEILDDEEVFDSYHLVKVSNLPTAYIHHCQKK